MWYLSLRAESDHHSKFILIWISVWLNVEFLVTVSCNGLQIVHTYRFQIPTNHLVDTPAYHLESIWLWPFDTPITSPVNLVDHPILLVELISSVMWRHIPNISPSTLVQWSCNRNREILEVPIYQAYFSGLCTGISPQNMVQYLHFWILKLWNSHWPCLKSSVATRHFAAPHQARRACACKEQHYLRMKHRPVRHGWKVTKQKTNSMHYGNLWLPSGD